MIITVNGIQQLDFLNTDFLAILDNINKRVTKTVQFDGTAGNGAVGTVNLFTITGGIEYTLMAFCTETLVDAADLATISVGVAGATAKLIAVTGAAGQGGVTISANEIWHDTSPDATIELTSDAGKLYTTYGTNIIATVAGEAITDGTLVFSLLYTVRTTNAVAEAA